MIRVHQHISRDNNKKRRFEEFETPNQLDSSNITTDIANQQLAEFRNLLHIQKQQTCEFTAILSEYKTVLMDIVDERKKIENLKKQKVDFDYYN